MKNRGLLWMCLLVAGAYVLNSPSRDVPTIVPPRPPAAPNPPVASSTQLELETTGDIQTFAGSLNLSGTMFVGASRLNVRSAPGATQSSIAILAKGSEVLVLEVREGWARIRTRDGKLRGWVSSNFLRKQRPVLVPAMPAFTEPNSLPVLKKPKKTVNREAVVREIIAFSIQTYSGRCPCPYNTMRNGRRCGGNSAYSRPGGRAPICYPEDVTNQMIEAWFARQ
jgi:SH3-like domain-containing protein